MSIIDAKQSATANWLASQIRQAGPGRTAVWNLAGAVGAGKSSVLRKVRGLLDKPLVPLLVTAPPDEVDAAPIALLEMATQLQAHNLMNGQSDVLNDLQASWADKLQAVADIIDQNADSVVILCDEPTRWYHRDEALHDDTPDYAARSLAEWIAETATCRRVIAGRLSGVGPAPAMTKAPRLDDAHSFVADYDQWKSLTSVAHDLCNRPLTLSHPTIWQMKLLVGLARFKTPTDVAREAAAEVTADVLLEELLDLFDQAQDHAFGRALVRLTIARTPLDRRTFDGLTSELSDEDRDTIKVCLCESVGDRLHQG